MTDRSSEPLNDLEKAVFGHDAKRRPDGSIIEQGSSHDPGVVAHREVLDARAAAAVKEPRSLKRAQIHPSHDTEQ
jgi:hypothetical protein